MAAVQRPDRRVQGGENYIRYRYGGTVDVTMQRRSNKQAERVGTPLAYRYMCVGIACVCVCVCAADRRHGGTAARWHGAAGAVQVVLPSILIKMKIATQQ